jgi:sortase A
MSDSLGGDGAGTDAAGFEDPIPRAVTTSTGTIAYAPAPAPGPAPADSGGPASEPPGRPLTAAEHRRAKRLAYWNRPKPPKDWRYWVGGVGRVLIVTGLLMFAFVAYQLWGTGIEEARAQNKLENELEERRATLATLPVTVPASTSAPETTPPADTTAPGETTPPATAPPATEAPPALPLPPIAEGDAIGELRIPRIDLEKVIVAGVSVPDLKKGPGHFPQTPMPGELGNAAIAGHRTTYGGPFLQLDEVEVGDEIVWVNLFGQEFVYQVTGSEIVKPSQGEVINTLDPAKATLTLVTCDPVRTSKNRLIVYAELVAERSPAPTAGQEYYGQEAGDPVAELPGEELPADSATADSATTGTLDESAPATAPATSVTGTTSTEPTDDPPAGFSDTDPFAQGWFSDTAAWPHIAAWGFLLVALCVGCYLLARALQRRWVGWIVAVAPFTFLLYFFFQNVNRLLPPGL